MNLNVDNVRIMGNSKLCCFPCLCIIWSCLADSDECSAEVVNLMLYDFGGKT